MNVILNYGMLLDMRMNIKRVGERWVDSNYRQVLLLDLTPNQLVFISDLRLPAETDYPIALGFELSSKDGETIMQSVGVLRWMEKCKPDGYYQYGAALESTITRLFPFMTSSDKTFSRQNKNYNSSYEAYHDYADLGCTLDKFV